MKRIGECTVGCGACCRVLSLQVPPEYMENPDIKKWVELHGIRLTRRDGGVFAVINQPCHALTEDGKCGVYGTDERPDLCSEWPVTPSMISQIPEVEEVCTYSFVEEAELVMEAT